MNLETPALIIEEGQVRRNIAKMAGIAAACGVALRPHAKTHKLPEIARLQIGAGSKGITTAKLAEAEIMAEQGIDDIFIAYPIVTEAKLERLATLSRRINVIAGVDSLEGATAMNETALRRGVPLQVRLEVDLGFGRTGVPYDHALELAAAIAKLEGLQFRGIYTFRGFFMNGAPTLELEAAGLEEGRLMVELAERMRAAGLEVRDVSVGSTPTAEYAARVPGVTEVRPGTYVYYDRMQAVLGSCTLDECAAAVRVTVVSRPEPGRLVVDGGSKTFATDVGPGAPPLHLIGYGHILEEPDAVLERVSEEHGMVRVPEASPLRVGDVLHIIPNHICSTVNLHSRVYLQDGGQMRELPVAARGAIT
ncbi:alanine racemase [Paenibacillus sp. IB182496]|uniref:Alanine racemase n=1 Tax=Paenibacillus sabuli TaxID=2772509 RepID=A0A927GS67_9BACL|nr:alanine racemase [Paenibacillus sabuli]MBD2845971.1 alanine racemase [Paenibacillus sabuli]